MTTIYISLGSNIEREHHIRAGLDALHAEFGELQVSRVFESEAVGFNGRPFYNLVISAETDLPLATVCQRLRAMEFAHGREPDAKKFAPRTLDLDLLLYGDLVCETPLVVPREEVLTNAFVLWPLAELAPSLCHPIDGRTMEALWQAYDKASQQLSPIPFHWKAYELQQVHRNEEQNDTHPRQVRPAMSLQQLAPGAVISMANTAAIHAAHEEEKSEQ